MTSRSPDDVTDDTLVRAASDPTIPAEERNRDLRGGSFVGQLIDRYVILHELGAGGMGVVYAAYDPQLDRKVAIKIIRPDLAGDSARQRLLREAQAMARVAHPNVIRIYDVGSTDDSVFMAMELIDGDDLAEVLATTKPDWPETLRLFLAAGRGVSAAHHAGLVHRDFKPANVLVGRDGVVRVIDFGLARAEGLPPVADADVPERLREESGSTPLHVSLTQAGAVMGTPLYMSPEQLQGVVADARSDQFSFCVALWESLYGTRPFAAQTIDELRLALSRNALSDPPKGTDVPVWIRKVLTRGLQRRPEDRWPSIDALLGALENDPRKRLRRRLGFGIAALSVVTAVLIWNALQTRAHRRCEDAAGHLDEAWNDEVKTRLHSVFAVTGMPFAEDSWKTTAHRLDGFVHEWTSLRTTVCSAPSAQVRQQTDCLEERAQEFTSLLHVLAAADLKVVEGSVSAAHALSSVHGCLTADVPHLEPAIEAKVTAARAQLNLAKSLAASGKPVEGLVRAREAELLARDAGVPSLLSETLISKADLEAKNGDRKAAETTLDDAVWSAQLAQSDVLTARAWNQMGTLVGTELGRPAEGARFCRFAAALIRRDGTNPELEADNLRSSGLVLAQQGKFDDALIVLRESLAKREALYGSEHPLVAFALSSIGNVFIKKGDFAQALPFHERTLAVRLSLLGPQHPDTSASYHNVAICLSHLGQLPKAIEYLERALAVDTAIYGSHSDHTAQTRHTLAKAWLVSNRLPRARDAATQAVDDLTTAFGAEGSALAPALEVLARVNLADGKPDEAGVLARRGLAIREKQMGPQHPILMSYLRIVAESELALHHPTIAVEFLERATRLTGFETVNAEERAPIEWTFAQALWAGTKAQQSEAIAHAALARDLFVKAGDSTQSALVSTWLTSHAH